MPIPFTLRQLEYFLAVAEHGSVTAAAEARHVSQPSISVAISDLEATLGYRLFQRRAGQRLAISTAGRRLLVEARTMMATASQIVGPQANPAERQSLAIGSFRDIGPMYLPRLLTRFARQNRNMGYRLVEGDLADMRSQLLDGRCEMALTYDIELKTSGISADPIDALVPYVMLASDHKLARLEAVSLDAISAERIVVEDFPVTLEYFLDIFRRRGLAITDIQKVSSFEMQRGLVANGWGVGLSCVRPTIDSSYDGAPLICRPLASRETPQNIVIAHLGEKTLSAPARRFRQIALETRARL